MAIFLRRYILPIALSFALYSITYFICVNHASFLNFGLLNCLLYAFLMRACDDFKDYQSDFEKGKAIFSLPILRVFIVTLTAVILLISIAFKLPLMIIALPLVLLTAVLKGVLNDFIKPLILPCIILTLSFSVFTFNYFLLILLALCVLFDIILIIRGKKK